MAECLALWLAMLFPQTAPVPRTEPVPQAHFVQANGLKLHYLDWDGTGQPLVFLTGFGTPAETFDSIALGLRDRFHVYALTRRGLAPSDEPSRGYDLATLVADVVGFLDARSWTAFISSVTRWRDWK